MQPQDTIFPASFIEAFWSHVQKTDTCWLWTGRVAPNGYGRIRFAGREWAAHRISWALAHDMLPTSQQYICHTCDVPRCVRNDGPQSHLWLGTAATNSADMVAKGRSLTGDRNPSRVYRERMPRGDNHPARLHPELWARGERSGRRLHPERYPSGDDHWSRQQPERMRGERNPNARLTVAQVREIRQAHAAGATIPALAARYAVTVETIRHIVHYKTWRHLPMSTE